MRLSPLNQRRWRNFKRNRRAWWSLIIFSVLFLICLPAEFVANDKPLLVSYRGELYTPVVTFYPETAFGGDFRTEAPYGDPEVECLIVSGGLEDCFDDPFGVLEDAQDGVVNGTAIEKGWTLWPLIPYSYDTPVDRPGAAPLPPNEQNWLGTDGTKRDVMARVIYGFRLSVLFALIVTLFSSIIGIAAGAVQGYFGGRTDLFFQRFIEVWAGTPQLYVIIILFAILPRSFWLLVGITVAFGWMGLVGVVRAEFLRGRNFEYITAARALGLGDAKIMWKHLLPNAMVATLTFLPFQLSSSISALTALDFLGLGLPPGSPSLGELLLQGKQHLEAPWLGLSGFFSLAIMLSLLIFIGEAVRDALDPRKTFR